MTFNSLYACSRCKREFNFSNIKYDDNNKLICIGCLDKIKKLEKKERLQIEKAENNEPIDFICAYCKYKFSIKKGSPQAVKCPYCAKTKLMIVKKYKNENDLMHDSMDHRFDF